MNQAVTIIAFLLFTWCAYHYISRYNIFMEWTCKIRIKDPVSHARPCKLRPFIVAATLRIQQLLNGFEIMMLSHNMTRCKGSGQVQMQQPISTADKGHVVYRCERSFSRTTRAGLSAYGTCGR